MDINIRIHTLRSPFHSRVHLHPYISLQIPKMLSHFYTNPNKSKGFSWVNPADKPNSHGQLSILYDNAPRVMLSLTLESTTGLSGCTSEELRIYTTTGDAVAIKKIPLGWLAASHSAGIDDIDFLLELPAAELERNGPPLIIFELYDRVVDVSVSELQRGLEGMVPLTEPTGSLHVDMGTLAEYYSTETAGGGGRPSMTFRVVAHRFPESTWRRKNPLLFISGPQKTGPSTKSRFLSPAYLKQRYESQMKILRDKYPAAVEENSVISRVYLDKVCFGGKDLDIGIPFGPGYMRQCAKQYIDHSLISTLLAIGRLLVTGFGDAAGTAPSSPTLIFNVPKYTPQRPEIVQAAMTLIPSMVAYLIDDRCRLDPSKHDRVRVEAPSAYALETGCLDCEDGSCLVCTLLMGLKNYGSLQLGSKEPTLKLVLDGGRTLFVSPKSADEFARQIAYDLAPLSPMLTLTDQWTPNGGFMGASDAHNPHATVTLLPTFSEKLTAAVPEDTMAPVSLGSLTTSLGPNSSPYAGLIVDSIYPITSPNISTPGSAQAIDAETDALAKFGKNLSSDYKVAHPTGAGTRYEKNISIFHLFTTAGGEYTVMDLTTNPKQIGCAYRNLTKATVEAFSPLPTRKDLEEVEFMSRFQYPMHPLVLESQASLELQGVSGFRSTLPIGTAPLGRVYIPNWTGGDVMHQVKTFMEGTPQERRTIGVFKLDLPGIVRPGLILLSWMN